MTIEDVRRQSTLPMAEPAAIADRLEPPDRVVVFDLEIADTARAPEYRYYSIVTARTATRTWSP